MFDANERLTGFYDLGQEVMHLALLACLLVCFCANYVKITMDFCEIFSEGHKWHKEEKIWIMSLHKQGVFHPESI